jgi:hypothetical protein
MDQNARIAALEYVVAYLLRERRDRDGKPVDQALDRLADSMLGSDGPGNPHTKLAAAEAIKSIKQLI